MKILKFLLLTLSFLSVSAEFHSWDKDLLSLDLDINPLELRNRAGCALDSKSATQSTFLLIDNTTMAKSTYRMAKLTGRDHDEVTKEAIKYYRKKVKFLFNNISEKLLTGKLPVLPVLSSKNKIPSQYKNIMTSCFEQSECDDLKTYLEGIWENSKLSNFKSTNRKIDDFNESNYITNSETRLSCLKLKKFSPLQAQLYGTKPDRETLQRIAESLKNVDEYIASCDADDLDNLKVEGLQFDLRNVDEKLWERYGFDYWNSLKIYFSWALKNTTYQSVDYELIIQSSSLEDSIMLVSNGCKTIEVPECSNDYLSKSVISEMAKNDYKKNALELDVLAPIVDGASSIMLDEPFTAVNNDILDLAQRRDANSWIESLFNNYAGTKAHIKSKLISGLSFYNIISKKVSVEKLVNDLQAYYNSSSLDDVRVKNDLYYLCSEVKFISDETFSYVRNNVEIIKETGFIDSLDLIFNGMTLEQIFDDYESLMKKTNEFCNALDDDRIWNEDFDLKRSGFSQWYLDKTLIRTKMQSTKKEDLESLNAKKYLEYSKTKSVICFSPSDCVRESISSMLEIARATSYAATFWGAKNKLKTSDVFNPYAERVACKVYDPWFKTRSTITNFVSDISQAFLSAFTPGVLYTKVSLKPGEVTSFNKMVKDGKILFNQKYKKESIALQLVTDFGPLLGVPCAVSVTGKSGNLYSNLYQFAGVSVGACSQSEDSQILVSSGTDVNINDPEHKGGCVSCQLNFESVSNTLSYFNYAVGPVYYLVRSFVRLIQGIKDPDNIPHDWTLNLNYLKNTYRRFGYIPKKCVKKLIDNKACLGSSEEELAVTYLQSKYDVNITAEDNRFFSGIDFKVDGCSSKVNVLVTRNEDSTSYKVRTNCKLKEKK